MRMMTTTARVLVFVCITVWIGILTPAVLAFKPKHHWDVTSEVLQETTLLRTINGHLLRFQPSAIIEIGNADVDQDDGIALKCLLNIGGSFSDSSNHFDSEKLLDASTKVVTRVNDAAKVLMWPTPNGSGARRRLGQALHGVQDYYAHSNWVETMSGTDDRLGVMSFAAVSESVQTCQAPPNTGSYVPFVGLTSGYWFGCFGRDDAALPPGKCYHGLTGIPTKEHAGTNKDDTDRGIGFVSARDAAKDSTRAIINRLLDTAGIAGNLNRTAALMGYRTNTFVIDTTVSMTTELPVVKAQVQEAVNAAIANGGTPGFVLVTFKDTVSEPFITNDPVAFNFAVNALTAAGGEWCPESSGAATLQGVKASVQGSRVITYTDATSNDPAAVWEAKLRAEADNIHVEVRSTGSCSPIDPAYKDLTTGTGGQLFSVQPSELSQLTPLTVPQVSGDFEPLLMANGVFSGTPRVFTVPIDWTVRHAVFSIAAEAAVSLTVTRPNGTVVVAGNPGVTIRNFSTGALVAVDSPQLGAWTLTVSGTGEYSVAVSGNTPLSVTEFSFADYITIRHPGFYPIKGQPLSGLPASAVSRVEGTLVPVTFEAISSDGVTLGTLPLSQGHPDAGDGDYTGTFDLPSQPFRVVARGVDGGTPFQRIVPTLFRPQPVSLFPDTVPENMTPGIQTVASFFVRNVGPAATFDLGAYDEHGFVTSVSPLTITLQQGEIGTVQVTLLAPLNPATGSPSIATQLTVSAAVQGQPSLQNAAFVDLDVTSVPPAAASAQYFMHTDFSQVTAGAFQLKSVPPDSPVMTRTSGNMKGRPPGATWMGWWETQGGIPGYEGIIPTASTVTVTLWMNKTTNWGTVFPYAYMRMNDNAGALFCEATGTTPLTTTLSPYTFSCATTQPITMWSTDRLRVFPGYSMTVGPGNHNMEIQMQLEGTSNSNFIVPNPR